MKKAEIIYREMLYQAIEKKNKTLTQSALSKNLNISLSVVNKAIQPLKNMGAIEVRQRNFHIVDIKKILYYWASIRNLYKDVVYSTRVEKPASEIEKSMPDDIIFSSYSAYKFAFKNVPADYSEIYIYGDLKEIEKRFPQNNPPYNLFVLKKDLLAENYGKASTLANIFVDLWNLKEWYAKEFLKAMEERLHGILE